MINLCLISNKLFCKNKKLIKNNIIINIIHIQSQMSQQSIEIPSTLELLNTILTTNNIKTVSKILNLSAGTINRWILLGDVPTQYKFDLLKILRIKIDYSKYSFKEKDQFFTSTETASHCYNAFRNILIQNNENESEFSYIEPSAGDGSFLKYLPYDRTISFDIEPRHPNIIEQDYLTWIPSEPNKRYVVFGNPPFGLRGHTALKFITHSYNISAEYVCFILPQLFESDGKGSPRLRIEGFNLIHSEKIKSKFYEPITMNETKKEMEINTIFQIWSKNHTDEKYELTEMQNPNLKIYSLSDGGSPGSTRNKKMLNQCDIYIPSTCFGKENMKYYTRFEDLPGKKGYGLVFLNNKTLNYEKAVNANWNEIAFQSTNSAYNLRSSQIYKLFN